MSATDKPKIPTATEMWDVYFKACYPAGLFNATQFRETQQAFMAGMLSTLGLMAGPVADLPEEEGAKVLGELINQTRQWHVARIAAMKFGNQ